MLGCARQLVADRARSDGNMAAATGRVCRGREALQSLAAPQ
jgi:hypothetical protein